MTAEKVVYINAKGQSIELSNRRPFLLESVDGRGGVAAKIQMQSAPFQDGSTFIDTTLETRAISLNVSLIAETRDELNELRNTVGSVFNPKLGIGKLVYSNGNIEREIGVVVDGSPDFPTGEAKGKWYQRTIINLIAPDPFWKGTITEIYKLEDFVGNFHFKFKFPVIFAKRGDSRVLINNGDVSTPIQVEFRGPVINPMITNNETGEFIKVNSNIPIGYKLILDTNFGSKRVEIIAPDGVVSNAFHYIDLESTFFSLDVGETRLSFISDSGEPEVYVKYQHKYMSV